MRKILKSPPVLIVVILFAGLISGCNKPAKDTPPGGESKQGGGRNGMGAGMRGPGIETAIAVFKPMALEKQYVGDIIPFFTVDLKSTASGWLSGINVDTGDTVHKNGVICTIKNDDIQAQVEQAQANILVAKAAVSGAEVDRDRLRLEGDRSESLFAKGYISKQELEQAQSSLKLAGTSLEAKKGQLALAEAQLKNIQVKLKDSIVKAPYSGVVAERYVDPGAYVSPANPIVRLEDNSKVKALINVVEDDFSRVRMGVIADVLIDSYPEEKFTGKIIRISPSMNKSSRTAAVELLIPNKDGKLKSGMTARVNLVLASKPSALVIPESALRRDVEKDFSYVFTVDKGTARLRKIETGIISAGDVEITSGLKPAETVVVGDVRISDGMKIETSKRKGGRHR